MKSTAPTYMLQLVWDIRTPASPLISTPNNDRRAEHPIKAASVKAVYCTAIACCTAAGDRRGGDTSQLAGPPISLGEADSDVCFICLC